MQPTRIVWWRLVAGGGGTETRLVAGFADRAVAEEIRQELVKQGHYHQSRMGLWLRWRRGDRMIFECGNTISCSNWACCSYH